VWEIQKRKINENPEIEIWGFGGLIGAVPFF
jgi:hypothetical protein